MRVMQEVEKGCFQFGEEIGMERPLAQIGCKTIMKMPRSAQKLILSQGE